MKEQYTSSNSSPKITAVIKDDTVNKKDVRQIQDLQNQVQNQQTKIDRMHRDIIRLREVINQLAAKLHD